MQWYVPSLTPLSHRTGWAQIPVSNASLPYRAVLMVNLTHPCWQA